MRRSASAIRFIAAGAMAALAAALMGLFSVAGGAFFPTYRAFSRAVMGALATASSIAPFSLWDFSAAALVLAALIALVRCIVRRKGFVRWLSWVCTVLAALALFLVGAWGLNHYAPPLADDLELDVGEYSAEELDEAARAYLDRACALAGQTPRNDDGTLATQDFRELATIAGESYTGLTGSYPALTGSTAPVKELALTGDLLLRWGSNGIFMPFTGESNVPAGCADEDKPFTMCHEVAHRFGLAGEEEANFAAFLACTASDDARFAYSGYYKAFGYCYSALAQANPDRAAALVRDYTDTEGFALVVQDMRNAADHYEAYEGALEDVGTQTNDVYLKSFSEEEGVRSYGQVVDYLIAWNEQEANVGG